MKKKKQAPFAATLPDRHDPMSLIFAIADDLHLSALRDQLPLLIENAPKTAPSYTDFILQALRIEHTARRNRRLNRNFKRAGLPKIIEDIDSFDFSIRPNLEPRVVKELLNCRWVEENRNIICVGQPGRGKSRILDTLAYAACKKGYSVKKVITAQMLEDLHASLADGSFKQTFRRFEKPDVLYCDEFGYAPFDLNATKYLFRLVSARYQNASILIAANTGFSNWKHFFPSEAQAVATVDRLIDNATILRFSGKGFRKPKEIIGDNIDKYD